MAYRQNETYSGYTQDVDYLIEQQRRRGATDVEVDFHTSGTGLNKAPVWRVKVTFGDGTTENISGTGRVS